MSKAPFKSLARATGAPLPSNLKHEVQVSPGAVDALAEEEDGTPTEAMSSLLTPDHEVGGQPDEGDVLGERPEYPPANPWPDAKPLSGGKPFKGLR